MNKFNWVFGLLVITGCLTLLKLCHLFPWSWWVVLIPYGVVVGFILLSILYYIIKDKVQR